MAQPDHANDSASNATTAAEGPAPDLPTQVPDFVESIHTAIRDGLESTAQTVGETVREAVPFLVDIGGHLLSALVV